ncbi:MAG: flippase-like domain-containing protein [bacterium]|nr:flippase-like domain-containing protein [bacterium]
MQLKRTAIRQFNTTKNYFFRQRRDSRYVFVFIISSIVFLISCLQAFNTGLFDSVERPIFDFFNSLPSVFDGVMHAITQLGGAGSILLWAALAYFLINRRAALIVSGTGILGWYIAKFFKSYIGRGRPEALLDTLNLFNDTQFGGFGFPSGHATFVAACVGVLYYQVDKKYRRYLLLSVILVGISRMYLGAHFPLDILGGWALGAVFASTANLLFGKSSKDISIHQIKTALRLRGYPMRHVEFANVDARGSRPVLMQDESGHEYFGKIFGVQEHAADWLFKAYRFFRFKNLQAEEPYISSRRNIEMESFATQWAKQAGIRVPKIIDIVRIRGSWMLILEKLKTTSIDQLNRITTKSLVDIWLQVEKLHLANMAHRDLRAANIMLDSSGKAWIIDFGFAEVAPRKQRQYMDIAELLMSMSLQVGIKRTVDSALQVVDHSKLLRVLPYLKREVFSGATAKSLREQKHLLEELKETLKTRLDVSEEIDEANITRINMRKILNILIVGVLLYVIIPQFNLFRGALDSLGSLQEFWLLPITVASLLTYAFSAGSLMSLSSIPLKFTTTSIVQLAASFVSKIIPGGVGSTGLNARYLTRTGHDRTDTAAILATNGVLGVLMFIVPVSLFILFSGENIASIISVRVTPRQLIIGVFAILLLLAVITLYKKLRNKIVGAIFGFLASIREFTNSPYEVLLACASSLAVSLSYVVCLYACSRAFGLGLGIVGAVTVYAAAVVAKSVVPTPGGLGPLEIAMVSAMITLGIGKSEAVSVVVLYRLATFWLPIPLSLLAYQYISNRKII